MSGFTQISHGDGVKYFLMSTYHTQLGLHGPLFITSVCASHHYALKNLLILIFKIHLGFTCYVCNKTTVIGGWEQTNNFSGQTREMALQATWWRPLAYCCLMVSKCYANSKGWMCSYVGSPRVKLFSYKWFVYKNSEWLSSSWVKLVLRTNGLCVCSVWPLQGPFPHGDSFQNCFTGIMS